MALRAVVCSDHTLISACLLWAVRLDGVMGCGLLRKHNRGCEFAAAIRLDNFTGGNLHQQHVVAASVLRAVRLDGFAGGGVWRKYTHGCQAKCASFGPRALAWLKAVVGSDELVKWSHDTGWG